MFLGSSLGCVCRVRVRSKGRIRVKSTEGKSEISYEASRQKGTSFFAAIRADIVGRELLKKSALLFLPENFKESFIRIWLGLGLVRVGSRIISSKNHAAVRIIAG